MYFSTSWWVSACSSCIRLGHKEVYTAWKAPCGCFGCYPDFSAIIYQVLTKQQWTCEECDANVKCWPLSSSILVCVTIFLKLHFRWVSADNLESFIETKGNQGNLQMTKAIARRFGWCQGVAIVKKMTDISQEIPSEKFEQDTICSWELCE